MRINDPKRFGTHIMVLRKNAGITLDEACAKLEIPKKTYAGIEKGLIGTELDDRFIDNWMDWLPGFSPATSPGVFGPPVRNKDLNRDGAPPSDRDRFMQRGEAAPENRRPAAPESQQPYGGLGGIFKGDK